MKYSIAGVVLLLIAAAAVLLIAAPTRIPIYQLLPGAAPGTVASIAVTLPNGTTAWLPLSSANFVTVAGTLGVLYPSPSVPNFADAETPAGTIDGTNAIFTLAHTPNPALSLELFRNGQLMKAGTGNDYTLAVGTVTFLAGAIPQAGDVLTASYRF
jgi:hypothetical protein